MPRLSIRLDPGFADRKRHYPDGPYRALVDAICAAEYEPVRGQFRSMAILRAVIGRSARHIPYLIAEHDLELGDDGRVNLIGWPVWQEGNHVPAERKQLIEAARADRHGAPPPERERSAGATRVAAHRERKRALQEEPGNALQDASGNGVRMQDGIAVGGLAVGGLAGADVTAPSNGADKPRPPSDLGIVKDWLDEHGFREPSGWAVKPFREMVTTLGPVEVIHRFDEARQNGVRLSNALIRWIERQEEGEHRPRSGSGGGHTRPAVEVRDAFER